MNNNCSQIWTPSVHFTAEMNTTAKNAGSENILFRGLWEWENFGRPNHPFRGRVGGIRQHFFRLHLGWRIVNFYPNFKYSISSKKFRDVELGANRSQNQHIKAGLCFGRPVHHDRLQLEKSAHVQGVRWAHGYPTAVSQTAKSHARPPNNSVQKWGVFL